MRPIICVKHLNGFRKDPQRFGYFTRATRYKGHEHYYIFNPAEKVTYDNQLLSFNKVTYEVLLDIDMLQDLHKDPTAAVAYNIGSRGYAGANIVITNDLNKLGSIEHLTLDYLMAVNVWIEEDPESFMDKLYRHSYKEIINASKTND